MELPGGEQETARRKNLYRIYRMLNNNEITKQYLNYFREENSRNERIYLNVPSSKSCDLSLFHWYTRVHARHNEKKN